MSQPKIPTDNTDSLVTDSIIGTIWSRLSSLTNLCATTATLAVAELKLAVSGALLALAAAALLVLMLLLTWAILLVITFHSMQLAGISTLTAMTIVLVMQLSICVLLVLGIRYLLRQARFTNTRNALLEASEPSSNPILTSESSL